MFLFIEPISKNTGLYVPAYPLPILEISSFIKINRPDIDIKVISIPMDYGLPLNKEGKAQIFRELSKDLAKIKPKGIGISCTAISQAEEVIEICNLIKRLDPDIFIFLGGYFPTIYYEEIFSKTTAVDVIVLGEGEESALRIIELLHAGKNPINENIPNMAWKKEGQIYLSRRGKRFDLARKALLNLDLLMHPREYDILPYAFSRGCAYGCNFCMEEFIRPHRRKVPFEIIHNDLKNLANKINAHTLLISDALFKSFDLFPLLRSLGMKVNFESRCDVLDPSLLSGIADVCGIIALGFESASYSTLRRMNKVKDKSHYEKYIANTKAIFKEAARNEIPMIIFMIAGYPGDTEKDLKESLAFVQNLSKDKGPGGHVFKIGECHVYPKTKIYDLAVSLPDVVFDDDGVFGQNIVRQPSKNLDFETILDYNTKIFSLSNYTQKIKNALLNIMPFFRLPAQSLRDDAIPDPCFRDANRSIFNVQGKSLSTFKKSVPVLTEKYKKLMSGQRNTRNLPL
ncbi:MAG: B12-binding domain-containing radical SAM protein [Deltaproteobacteria bacterium]|nr:B12-binding domain-containing radical SAM protein [Deltaproteobacteria bacterium]